jgi:hypothetical protein
LSWATTALGAALRTRPVKAQQTGKRLTNPRMSSSPQPVAMLSIILVHSARGFNVIFFSEPVQRLFYIFVGQISEFDKVRKPLL